MNTPDKRVLINLSTEEHLEVLKDLKREKQTDITPIQQPDGRWRIEYTRLFRHKSIKAATKS